MSVDRSLKSSSTLTRHRNVLTRAERLIALEEDGRWEEDSNSVFGLPKVGNRKIAVAKKKKAKGPEEEGEGDEAAAAVAPAE